MTLFLLGLLIILTDKGILSLKVLNVSKSQFRSYTKEFTSFCAPLIPGTVLASTITIFDFWLLQKISGSLQQGYYGISLQVGALCLLFTSAMAPLFMREFSKTFAEKNIARLKRLYSQHIPFFYAMAATISVFVAVQSKNLVILIGKADYQSALIPIILMAFYPIHQTYGQLSGTVFLATERTKLFRNIDVAGLLFGLGLTFVFMGPTRYYGMQLGAVGLCLKKLITNFVLTNAYMYYNAKYLKVSFKVILSHQIKTLAAIGLVGIGTFACLEYMGHKHGIAFDLIVGGLIYLGGIVTIVLVSPSIYKVRMESITNFILTNGQKLRERFSQ